MMVAWIKVVAVEVWGEVGGLHIGSILRVKAMGFANGEEKKSMMMRFSA